MSLPAPEPRKQYNVGAVKIPYAQRDVAHAVLTEADDRGFYDIIGADTPDDHDVFPVGAHTTYRVELTDAEADRFRAASNCRYVTLDATAYPALVPGWVPIPEPATMAWMRADFTGVAAFHGRDVTVGVLDGGTTAAVRTYLEATLVGRQVFGTDNPGAGVTMDHGCLIIPILMPQGGRFLDAIISTYDAAHGGTGLGSTTVAISVAAMKWCADNGAKVVNYSWGLGGPDPVYVDGAQYLLDRGVQLFAPAGNDGLNQLDYPAALSTTFSNVHSSISFSKVTGLKSSFSNYATTASGCGPGDDELGLDEFGSVTPWAGTSCSTPHMARLCVMGATGGRFTAAQVGAALKAHTRYTGQPAAEQGGGAYSLEAALTALGAFRPPATSYVDIDLTNGTSYSYTVSALDAAGNESAQSSAVSATATGVPLTGAAFLPGRLTNGKIEVQIAWGANLAADETTWTWSDITTHVRQDPGISTALGRNDESATSNPATLTVVLNNSNSDYSLGTISAHYPNVRRGTPVRVRIDPGDGVGGRIVFQGNADGFTPGWDTLKGTLPVVTLSASGILRRLSQGAAPLQSVYRRVMTASPTVQAYWPMEEGRSSQFAYPVRGGTPFTYTGGSPSWAADDSFDCSAPLPVLANAYGQADVTPYTDTGASQLRFLLSVPEGGLTDGTVLLHVEMTGSIHRWDLTYGITNGVEALGLYRYDAPAIPGTFNSSDPLMLFNVNGVPGRLGLDWTQSGSNIVWTLSFTPATPGASATFIRRTLPSRTAGIVSHFEINPHNANIGATIGHITVENTITSFFADTDALIAYAGETNTSSSGRLARLCAENGVPLQRYAGVASDVVPLDLMGPQLVAPLLDLLHECEVSGQGQLWDGRGAGLSYTTHKRREVGTVKLTVNAAAKQLAGDFQPIDDDQRNRNKVTVTRLHGASYTWEDTSGPLGTAAIGVYDAAVTVNCGDDDSVVNFAKWFVLLGTVPGYRYPTVTVDLSASPTLAPAVLDIVPGERINVTGLDTTLAGFPDATVSLIVEGIAHQITTRTWTVTFRCSPYLPWATGIGGV